ncbi:hypothetical protein LINPERHAP1_LOCUS18500 [Linum perenne]
MDHHLHQQKEIVQMRNVQN